MILSLLLFSIKDDIILFLGLYAIAGFTDIADGFIARKYYLETSFGAKLDSLADFIFLLTSLFRMVFSYRLNIPTIILICGSIVAMFRIINFGITKVKFHQWGMLHTIGNKLTGLIIFFLCPLAIIVGSIPVYTVIIPILSAIEETIILLISCEYNPNVKTIFHNFKLHFLNKSIIKGVSENG